LPSEHPLLSAVIPLTALDTPPESAFLGRATHAWFLNLVASADPARAEALHASRARKPFTVSAVFSEQRPGLVQPEVRAGEGYWLRFTAIEDELVRLLLDRVLPCLPETVQLGAASFRLGTPITDPQAHPWARLTTAGEMVEHWFGGRRATRTFNLHFASPTAVRRIRRNVVVPLPEAIFGGYLRAWNAYCAPVFDRDLLDLVGADVAITRYELRTTVVRLGQAREIGCVGRCGYTIFRREPAAWKVINLLSDFAQFCGTGYATTRGLGQTRHEDVRRKSEHRRK